MLTQRLDEAVGVHRPSSGCHGGSTAKGSARSLPLEESTAGRFRDKGYGG